MRTQLHMGATANSRQWNTYKRSLGVQCSLLQTRCYKFAGYQSGSDRKGKKITLDKLCCTDPVLYIGNIPVSERHRIVKITSHEKPDKRHNYLKCSPKPGNNTEGNVELLGINCYLSSFFERTNLRT